MMIYNFASKWSIFEHGKLFRVDEIANVYTFYIWLESYFCPTCLFDTIDLYLFYEDMVCLSSTTDYSESYWLLYPYIWGTSEGVWQNRKDQGCFFHLYVFICLLL